jgi:hypothetical protein
MRKFILLTIVLGVFVATNVSAAPTTCTCYGAQDAGGNWWYLLDYDGNPLANGDFVYVAWTGPDGEIDPPATAKEGGKGIGDCTDDDVKLASSTIYWGGFTIPVTIFDAPQNPTTGDLIYCRIFDADSASLTTANYYGDSDLHTCTHQLGEQFFAVFPGDPDSGHTDTPLPVELMSFDAIARDGEVLLEWKTATEINLLGFYIERDGKIESELIEGHGNSTIEQTYTWLDDGLTNGVTYYYNLITKDLDGVEMVANEEPLSATPTAHIPTVFALHQNYPNPFNPWTEIKYDIPKDAHVTLKVYNVLGAEVATLVDKDQKANFYTVRWDAKDLASGVYFCTITADDFKAVKKMVLLK